MSGSSLLLDFSYISVLCHHGVREPAGLEPMLLLIPVLW